MKFSCSNYDILTAINAASKATASNSSFPILETLLIEAGKDIKITGSNNEITIEYVFEANIFSEGSIAVDSKMLSEIIRRMPEGMIDFEVKENLNVNITCGELDFYITGISGEEFPKIPEMNYDEEIITTAESLLSVIRKTSFAVAQSDINPILTGIKLEINSNNMKGIAVDGYRLAIKNTPIDVYSDISFTVQGRALNELSKIMNPADDKVSINLTDKNVLFSFGSCRFFSRLLEGEFINYNNVIPKEKLYSAKVEVKELIKSIDRASLLAEAGGIINPVKISYDYNNITITCDTVKGHLKEVINVNADGKETFTVGYNCKFMLDALKAIDDEYVMIELNGSITPTVLRPIEGDEFLYIVLPVKIR